MFSPYRLGTLELPNRIVMAPMTRARAGEDEVPSDLAAAYYAQRAGAGLIVTEATQVGPGAKGYSRTPGLYTPGQIAAWGAVTGAVHDRGGRIVAQLWHTGRVSHPMFHGGEKPPAPSAIAPADTAIWALGPDGQGGMVPCVEPREMDRAEIAATVAQFAQAAANAVAAGFDGVELHAANGYLIEQFLRDGSNRRGDAYGGSVDNRLRFLTETVEAVAAAIGAERTGVRLSPLITLKGMSDSDPRRLFTRVVERLDALGVARLHIAEDDWDNGTPLPADWRRDWRARFSGAIIVAGRYTAERAAALLDAGLVDLVAFGRPFIANPDLPERLRRGLPLAAFDPGSLFGGGAAGYTDHPEAA
nr:alkene reductase [Azospirillum picis]